MPENYGVTSIGSFESRSILASNHPTKEIPIILGTVAATSYKRGQLLGKQTADGKYYEYDSAAADGTEVLAGVLVDAVDVSAGDENGKMYVSGEFLLESLFAAQTIVEGSYNNGSIVILKERK